MIASAGSVCTISSNESNSRSPGVPATVTVLPFFLTVIVR